MTVSLVLAISENGVIGRTGGLPWHLPEDLHHFKSLTMGHTVVMGRKTFEAVGRPLRGRHTVVVTKDRAFQPEGVTVAHNIEDALGWGTGDEEIFVAGGADVYRQTLPYADRVYLTLVHARVEGDVDFAELDLSTWKLVEEQFHARDERHEYSFSIRVYSRQ